MAHDAADHTLEGCRNFRTTRASRRRAQGHTDQVAERDRLDSTRKTSPLVIPEGATVMLLRAISTWVAWTLLTAAPAASAAADTSRPAQAMLAAAQALMEATAASQKPQLMQPFTLEARGDWNYTPRGRAGIPFKSMSDAQRQVAQRLLAAALSEPGLLNVRAIISLEIALRELESFGPNRDPENYAFAIFGTPHASDPWGWRIEGHHLSLHFTLAQGKVVATLPSVLQA